MRKKTLFPFHYCVAFILLANTAFSQRIVGYIPSYKATYDIQYSKTTHVIYGWIEADASGNLIADPGLNQVQSKINNLPANQQPKLIVSTGGWGDPNIDAWMSSATTRHTFITQMVALIESNNLDGFDLDWEFPSTSDQLDQQLQFFTEMKTALDKYSQSICKKIELSMAVGGTYAHTAYLNPDVIDLIDYFNIMAYDLPGSTLDGASTALDAWNGVGVPYSKMTLGLPFYADDQTTYAAINSCNCAAPYNTDSYNGHTYNGCPTLHAKVDLAKSVGCAGVMIWEMGQDILTTTNYSLLANCLNPYVVANWGVPSTSFSCCKKPDLGADLIACAGATFPVILNSNCTSGQDVTFTWKKISPATQTYSGSNTLTVTSVMGVGTYVVTRDSAGICSKSDTIVIGNVFPVPDLGSTIGLCAAAEINLIPANYNSFPGNTNWKWQKNGVDIKGGISASLNVRTAGVFSLFASAGQCTSTSGSVTVTSDLPSPVDSCGPMGSVLNLAVNGSGSSYKWYAGATGGTVLATGKSFQTPALSATTTYYVQSGDTTFSIFPADTSAFTEYSIYGDGTMQFKVTSPVKIKSVDMYAPIQSLAQSQQIAIMDYSKGYPYPPLFAAYSNDFDVNGDTDKRVITISFDTTLNAGTYGILFRGNQGNLYGSSLGSVPQGIQLNQFQADVHQFFFNWIIESPSLCARMPVIAMIGDCNLGVKEVDGNDTKPYIAPNPFSESTQLYFNGITGNSGVSVYDMLGNVLLNEAVNEGTPSVMIGENLIAGFYICKVVTADNKQYAFRIVKQ